MKNWEYIQDLNVRELATIIFKISNNELKITTCEEDCKKCEKSDGWCISGIAEWLQEEVVIIDNSNK